MRSANLNTKWAAINPSSQYLCSRGRQKKLTQRKSPIPNDGERYSDIYNKELESLRDEEKDTWFTAPWLYAEFVLLRRSDNKIYSITSAGAICRCFLILYSVLINPRARYRLLRSYFVQTQHWKDFDPFFTQKNRAFKLSYNSILRMCSWAEPNVLSNITKNSQPAYTN